MNTRKLSVYLSKWCKANGFDVSVNYGEDFAFYFNRNTVQYCLLTDGKQSEWFNEVFKNEGLVLDYDNFITSFFHELGHYETDDEWSEKESEKFQAKKETLNGETKKGNFEYFYMPDELMATRWAVDYINDHTNEIDELWENVKRMVFEIYEELGFKGN